ncbi:MAG: hypothetical protein LBK73_00965 [Treponema sp.]|jgi:hypothetical protein|nr:hypothetical protein [Treponema sp.]
MARVRADRRWIIDTFFESSFIPDMLTELSKPDTYIYGPCEEMAVTLSGYLDPDEMGYFGEDIAAITIEHGVNPDDEVDLSFAEFLDLLDAKVKEYIIEHPDEADDINANMENVRRKLSVTR